MASVANTSGGVLMPLTLGVCDRALPHWLGSGADYHAGDGVATVAAGCGTPTATARTFRSDPTLLLGRPGDGARYVCEKEERKCFTDDTGGRRSVSPEPRPRQLPRHGHSPRRRRRPRHAAARRAAFARCAGLTDAAATTTRGGGDGPPVAPGNVVLIAHQVEVSFVASGSVDDYDDAKRGAIASKLADAAGADAADVTVVVTAASVMAAPSTWTPSASSSASVANALSIVQRHRFLLVESAVTLEAKVKRAEAPCRCRPTLAASA